MSPAIRTVHVPVDPPYAVRVGPGVLRELPQACAAWTRVFVLTDEHVARALGDRLPDLENAFVHTVPPGEGSKSFAELERVLDAMVSAGCDGGSGLVAFGGGVVGDLGGLASGLFHRGVACVQAPTTLLAMVDSSVGGKTAVNLTGGKNLAGLFHQPSAVLADTRLLATLPEEEYRSGLGEVLKTAVLSDVLLDRLEAEADAVVRRDAEVLAEVVEACVARKAAIVALDPHEAGPRRMLNLGHTFAHAIEVVAGYGRVPHGVAVAVGLDLVLRAAQNAGVELDATLAGRCRALGRRLGLPTTLADLERVCGGRLGADALLTAMTRDKKSRSGEPLFVVPHAPGRVEYDVRLPRDAVRAALVASAVA